MCFTLAPINPPCLASCTEILNAYFENDPDNENARHAALEKTKHDLTLWHDVKMHLSEENTFD